MFIKKDVIRDGIKLFGLMSRTRSYTYKELQALTNMESVQLCFAILQLLRENKITQTLNGTCLRYVVC